MRTDGRRIVIIGDGFAGLHAARTFARSRSGGTIDLTLLGRGENTFLPLLPDVVAGNLSPESLIYNYEKEITRYGFNLRKDFASAVDHAGGKVLLKSGGELPYDHLLICNGSIPAFKIENTLKLTSIEEAVQIRDTAFKRLREKGRLNAAVIGGGYTGVEAVTALWALSRKMGGRDGRFILIEKAPQILGPIGEYERGHVLRELKRMGIEVFTEVSAKVEADRVLFEGMNPKEIPVDLVITSAGVKGAAGTLLPQFTEERSGRLRVDLSLRVTDGIYAAGDAAFFEDGAGRPLHQSVNYAIFEGRLAARNILSEMNGRKLKKYRPFDLGYMVPSYSGRAWGRAVGVKAGGRIGMGLHYLMCVYRSLSFKKQMEVLRGLLSPPALD